MPSPTMPGLHAVVGARLGDLDLELALQPRRDVLDLGDDAVALAVEVELVDLRPGVGDLEGDGAGLGRRRRQLAGRVGRVDDDRPRLRPRSSRGARRPCRCRRRCRGRRSGEGCGRSAAQGRAGHEAPVSVVLCVGGVMPGGGSSARPAVPGGWAGQAATALLRLGRRRRHGGAALDRAQEEREDDADVEHPGDGLEHGRGRREVEDALEERGVPAARVDRGADVEGEVGQAGQELPPPAGRGCRRRGCRRRRGRAGCRCSGRTSRG